MLTKSHEAHIKAADDGGEFEAIVSVFGNIDQHGDVVMPGAFEETVKEWQESGRRVPVILSHKWNEPDAHIGEVVEMAELGADDDRVPDGADGALWVRASVDDDPSAQKVRRLLKGGRIRQFSFAYEIEDAAMAERDGVTVYELRKLKLLEVGPTFRGANPATDLLDAKSGDNLTDRIHAAVKHALTDAPKSAPEPHEEPPAEDAKSDDAPQLDTARAALALLGIDKPLEGETSE